MTEGAQTIYDLVREALVTDTNTRDIVIEQHDDSFIYCDYGGDQLYIVTIRPASAVLTEDEAE